VGTAGRVSATGGAWGNWLSGTRATSDVWLGRDANGYAFRVRARDSKGNVGVFNATSRWDSTPALAVGGFGRVVTDGLSYRTGPDTSAARLGTLDAGTIVAVTRGPVSQDGATWYEVTQPIREWNPVTFVERGVWVATASSGKTHVKAYRAPNSPRVDAGLVGQDFGRDRLLRKGLDRPEARPVVHLVEPHHAVQDPGAVQPAGRKALLQTHARPARQGQRPLDGPGRAPALGEAQRFLEDRSALVFSGGQQPARVGLQARLKSQSRKCRAGRLVDPKDPRLRQIHRGGRAAELQEGQTPRIAERRREEGQINHRPSL